jgi:hypothetical protein
MPETAELGLEFEPTPGGQLFHPAELGRLIFRQLQLLSVFQSKSNNSPRKPSRFFFL